MTKNTHENPWSGMPPNSKRRIEEWSQRNLFWITDINGAYGFNIQSSKSFHSGSTKLRLKGIEIVRRNSSEGADFFLLLSRKEDWQIFHILCSDLISAAIKSESDDSMVLAIVMRLRRWQQFLKSDVRKLSVEAQMGLFAELLFLRDVVLPRVGFSRAVAKWGGPDADKQDFVFDSVAIEVKSYPSSKGPIITISSAQQLWSDKESLIIAAYGLSPSDNGQTIEDVYREVLALLETDDASRELFEAKVGQYGYLPELNTGELAKFLSDRRRYYFVTEFFPRIDPGLIAGEITSVKYLIDLARCVRFEISEEQLQL